MHFPKDPGGIEDASFDIIESNPDFKEATRDLSLEQRTVVRRVVHATADFEYARNMIFHRKAISAGLSALKSGRDIITDVEMLKAGISVSKLTDLGCDVKCFIRDPDVAQKARQLNTTRSIIAMRKAADHAQGNIIAIGNAPTALEEVIHLATSGLIHPALIIGVPVGFIAASDSKASLALLEVCPFITSLGNKGGSSVVASILNSLINIAISQKAMNGTQV